MTPKEKAEGLYRKVENSIYLAQYTSEATKQCALIAVDVVLSTMDEEDNYVMYKYWNEVKQEIESL